jgi:hypothetical protein
MSEQWTVAKCPPRETKNKAKEKEIKKKKRQRSPSLPSTHLSLESGRESIDR